MTGPMLADLGALKQLTLVIPSTSDRSTSLAACVIGKAEGRLKSNFYQLALDPTEVIKDFKELGFTVAHRGGQSSFDCLADETRWFQPVDRLLRSLPIGLRTKIGVIADMIVGKCFGHVALLVLRKNRSGSAGRETTET